MLACSKESPLKEYWTSFSWRLENWEAERLLPSTLLATFTFTSLLKCTNNVSFSIWCNPVRRKAWNETLHEDLVIFSTWVREATKNSSSSWRSFSLLNLIFSQTKVTGAFSIKNRNDRSKAEVEASPNGQYPAQKAIMKRKMADFSSVFFKLCFQKSDFFNSNDTVGSRLVRRGD